MTNQYLWGKVLGLFAVKAISHKVQHIASVDLLIRRAMKPATDEVLDGQYSMQLQKALLDFLHSLDINLFDPFSVDYSVPEGQFASC